MPTDTTTIPTDTTKASTTMPDSSTASTSTATTRWWKATREWATRRRDELIQMRHGQAGPLWLYIAGGITAVFLIAWLLAAVLIPWIGSWFTAEAPAPAPEQPAGKGLAAVLDWEVTRTLSEPLIGWLTSHASGLPARPATVLWCWGIGGALLLFASMAGSWGGRLGWTLFGAASVYMIWAGTPGPGQPVAAGLAGLLWLLLTVPALTGLGKHPRGHRRVEVVNHIERPQGGRACTSRQ